MGRWVKHLLHKARTVYKPDRCGTTCNPNTQEVETGAGEKTQWLRALAALPENPGSIPRTHLVAHNLLELQF